MIESVTGNSLTVNTTDKVGFDKAAVSFDKALSLDFTPEPGMTVEITILPEIRERTRAGDGNLHKTHQQGPCFPDPKYKNHRQEAKALMERA
jgi:hypothetical protein